MNRSFPASAGRSRTPRIRMHKGSHSQRPRLGYFRWICVSYPRRSHIAAPCDLGKLIVLMVWISLAYHAEPQSRPVAHFDRSR